MMKEFGGVSQDKKKAFEYFKRSADLGNAKAQLIVGIKYEIGDGCEKDLIKAKEYIEKSVNQGNQEAQE